MILKNHYKKKKNWSAILREGLYTVTYIFVLFQGWTCIFCTPHRCTSSIYYVNSVISISVKPFLLKEKKNSSVWSRAWLEWQSTKQQQEKYSSRGWRRENLHHFNNVVIRFEHRRLGLKLFRQRRYLISASATSFEGNNYCDSSNCGNTLSFESRFPNYGVCFSVMGYNVSELN